jgi:hypothetical protein
MNYKFTALIIFLMALLVIFAEPAYPEQNKIKTPNIKFILTIRLCSFIENKCLPNVQVKDEYDSWKECTLAALEISKEIIISQEDTLLIRTK